MNELQLFISDNTAKITTIITIALGAWVVKKFGMIFISRLVRKVIKQNVNETLAEEKRRENTITEIVESALGVILWAVAGMIILSQLGIDIAPILAGAGVIGLAVGFGGQYLIKDLISGLFIILENQYRVGDVVQINGVSGKVEEVTLRLTKLRDLDGVVHHVPNGSIVNASNYSKEFSSINLNIGVAYDSDIKKVREVVNKVGEKLANDKEWKDKILEKPEFLRVDNFGDSAIDIKVVGKVLPLEQWAVTGELRTRLKIAFDEAGIEIPFPHRVVYQADR